MHFRFFEDVFLELFRSSFVNESIFSPPLSNKYMECLKSTYDNVRPFGIVPELLVQKLVQSAHKVRLLLMSLDAGASVLFETAHWLVTPECSRSLARLGTCALCRGADAARPCRALCVDSVRNVCLVGVLDVDSYWNEFIQHVVALHQSMNDDSNLETVLFTMHTNLSESLLSAVDVIHGNYEQVC